MPPGLPCAAPRRKSPSLPSAVSSGSVQGIGVGVKKSPLAAICASVVLRANITSP